MNHTEQYSDRELQEMQEKCLYVIHQTMYKEIYDLVDIIKIALIEINKELDERKIRKENLLCK